MATEVFCMVIQARWFLSYPIPQGTAARHLSKSSTASSTNVTEEDCSQWVDLDKLFTYDNTTTGMYVTDLIHAWFVLLLDRHNWLSSENIFYFFAVLIAWNTERLRCLLSTPGVQAAQASRWIATGWARGSLPISSVNKTIWLGRLGPFVCRQWSEVIFPFPAAK